MNQIISNELIKDIVTTELPIIIDKNTTDLPLIDTTKTLANYALNQSIK